MPTSHAPSDKSVPTKIPTLEDIRTVTKEKFGRYPCLWQAQVAQALLRGNKDVIVKSGTGSGKTLTFWMPLLFSKSGIQVVITPLNLLGSQNEAELRAMKIDAIAINGKNVTHQKIQDICDGRYRVVIVNPEIALGAGSIFDKVWKCDTFKSRLLSIIWDEAHCVSAWSTFRKEYKEAGRLRLLLGRRIPFYAASATLPPEVLTDVMSRLRMQQDSTTLIERSNDRPNVYLSVRRIQHALDSFRDLDFLIPKEWTPNSPLPKFLVFFDDIAESVAAAKRLRSRLPKDHQHLVKWFNSEMTPTFREDTTREFKDGRGVCGLYTTDSFGLGMDVPDIPRVYQWRATCDLNTLWQRFGRAARGPGTEAVGVLFAEAKYFDEEKERVARTAKARAEKATAKAAVHEKAKRVLDDVSNSPPKAKRPKVTASDQTQDVILSESSSLTVYEELRVIYKAQATKKKAMTTLESKIPVSSFEVGAEMDAFINAATRSGRCFRLPIMAYYENDRRNPDYLLCSPRNPQGCARCNIMVTTICCELCNSRRLVPSPIFTFFLPPVMVGSVATPAPSAATRASRLPKFSKTALDFQLRDALDRFRRQKMEELYGHHALNTLNAGAIMGDEVLERIADCAHSHRLRTVEDIRQQVPKWRRVNVYAAEVLTLVHRYFPLPSLYTTTPLRPTSIIGTSNVVDAVVVEHSKRVYKCGICRQSGHRQRNGKCPFQQAKPHGPRSSKSNLDSENTTQTIAESEVIQATPPAPVSHNNIDILQSLISGPSYRQRSRVMRGPELEAMLLARQRTGQ